ncbi:PilZ domain-containing protein [Brevibacillus centrosporus]|uniref:PilZ domain-containing protein n=1 Tax=Brevibacillus centrosporus TaxID=54910 RepID=A0A1I3QTT4_9BACL|nr:PilZ domain-containing protein [Brevibacillus centrosporus]MEC2129497.1 PilZ domain-containing protein [Brevibacillus centrosporus]MED4908922.1 PilZ domain-containing protein [Brevibacillus centrosporus]RNB65508.1 PilZ domain-containing protein [Brevibacillus centrosporus]SFJ36651.1 PilZ domain-containing protein [Brevibacillus centrosporus]
MESILQIKRDNRMIEGQVTYEEGDLIEAVFPSLLDVTVGDQLPCLMTSDYETISNFEAVVVAKEKNRLFLFHSPTVSEFREQRRRYPRFDMEMKGWIQYPSQEPDSLFSVYSQMVDLVNLSLGGLAFRTDKSIPEEQAIVFSAELYGRNRPDGVIKAELKIIHERIVGPNHLFGCTINGINARHFHNLRKYILQRQIEERRKVTIE